MAPVKSLIEIGKVCKRFDGVKALDDFSCEIGAGEILGLVGPNGAGKTTLFNIINGLLTTDSGSVLFKGQELIGWTPHRVASMGIARTFQECRLIRRIRVIENVLLGFRQQPGENLLSVFVARGLVNRHETRIRAKAMELLDIAGLTEEADDLADNLSYGQQKLLTLVACIAADAQLLLLDEPVAGIAAEMAERVLAIIADLPNQGKSAIVIEHDIEALRRITRRMIFMDVGRKVCEGSPDEVLRDPRVIEAYLD